MGSSLVYHAGALGDFLTTLPAMGVWRRLHEKDTIMLLGRTNLAELAPEGLFDEVWDARSSRFAPLFSGPVERATSLGVRLAAFQSALLFSSAPSGLPASLRGLGVGEILRQDPFPADRIPAVDYHLSLFRGLTLTAEDRVPRVRRGGGRIEVPANTAALHPGSGDRRKNWPLAKFVALAEKLRQAGLTVRWVLGPAEEDAALPPGERTWRSADLRDLAAALSVCRLYVGNDSGVSHLAAACGCLTVALFGATDAVVWAPRGPCVRVVASPGGMLEALSVETVFSECWSSLRQ